MVAVVAAFVVGFPEPGNRRRWCWCSVVVGRFAAAACRYRPAGRLFPVRAFVSCRRCRRAGRSCRAASVSAASGSYSFAAIDAQSAHQALGDHHPDGAGDQERLDAHVQQTGQAGGGIIGVQGAEDQVAGQGGLDGQVGRFAVADLADHDDVRVLAQQGPQAVSEGHAGYRVDLGLVGADDVVFHRVFDGRNVNIRAC